MKLATKKRLEALEKKKAKIDERIIELKKEKVKEPTEAERAKQIGEGIDSMINECYRCVKSCDNKCIHWEYRPFKDHNKEEIIERCKKCEIKCRSFRQMTDRDPATKCEFYEIRPPFKRLFITEYMENRLEENEDEDWASERNMKLFSEAIAKAKRTGVPMLVETAYERELAEEEERREERAAAFLQEKWDKMTIEERIKYMKERDDRDEK